MPPPRLFLISRFKKDFAYEVVSFDKAKKRAVLWGNEGYLTDILFDMEINKRCYTLVTERPPYLRNRNATDKIPQ